MSRALVLLPFLSAIVVLHGCGGARCGEGTVELEGVCVPEDGVGYTCADACEKQANVCGHFASTEIGTCTDFCRSLPAEERNLTCFRDSNCAEIGAKKCAKQDDGGGEPVDHTARCKAFCVPSIEASSDPAPCFPDELEACEDECLALLDGFSTVCASCVLGESDGPERWSGSCDSEDFTASFTNCGTSCAGNRRVTSVAERAVLCQAFCHPKRMAGDEETCFADEAYACESECKALLEGLERACAVCLLSESDPPEQWSVSCDAHDFGTIAACSSYCSG